MSKIKIRTCHITWGRFHRVSSKGIEKIMYSQYTVTVTSTVIKFGSSYITTLQITLSRFFTAKSSTMSSNEIRRTTSLSILSMVIAVSLLSVMLLRCLFLMMAILLNDTFPVQLEIINVRHILNSTKTFGNDPVRFSLCNSNAWESGVTQFFALANATNWAN